MKRFLKIAAVLTSIILIIAIVSGCGTGNKSKLVGKWERIITDDGFAEFDELEFFSDGTYTSDDANYFGNYSVDGNRIKLTGVLVEPISCSFSVSGDTLTLTYKNYIWKYSKAKEG